MILIIAPSKTQQFQQSPRPKSYPHPTMPRLLSQTTELIASLRKLSEEELGFMLKTSARLTASAYHAIHTFSTPLTMKNSESALRLFQGDAYDAIYADNYSTTEMLYAQKHLRILCGLYGLLRPLDLVQPYRLEMQSKIVVGQSHNLYQFWRKTINDLLLADLGTGGEIVLVNLASAEYTKSIDSKRLAKSGGMLIDIIFQQPSSKAKSGYKTIPIHAKRARGMMIDYAISNKITSAEKLKEFTVNDYFYNEELSTDTRWLFRQCHQ